MASEFAGKYQCSVELGYVSSILFLSLESMAFAICFSGFCRRHSLRADSISLASGSALEKKEAYWL